MILVSACFSGLILAHLVDENKLYAVYLLPIELWVMGLS